MDEEVKKFLEAVEISEKLLEDLKKLHTAATSYQTAREELNLVREKIINLIESVNKLVNDSHEIIKILKEIGMPEVMDKLKKMEERLLEEFDKQGKYINKLKTFIIMTFASSIIAVIMGVIKFLK